MEKVPKERIDVEYLKVFQDRIQKTEEKYKDVSSSSDKIIALLEEITDFYCSKRTFIFEVDWDMELGMFTYDYQKNGTAPKTTPAHIPLRGLPKWISRLKLSQTVILDHNEIQESHIDYPEIESWSEIQLLMAAPFSNRLSKGFVCVVNPERYHDNPSYLTLMSYAVVADLNELKLRERVDIVEQQVSKMNSNEIRVNCFGGLEIHSAKGVLSDDSITADQCYRLLAYLLMNHKKVRPVRELADIIWNDVPINDPYRDIKNIVYRLKRFLSVIELEDLVIGTSGTFAINPKYRLSTDFEDFEDACNSYFRETDPKRVVHYYQKAKELYQGALLPRCDHLHWFLPRTGYYQAMYLNLLKKHMEEDMECGDYFGVQKIAVEGLEIEPYDSDFMTHQIVSLFEQGNRSMANSYYHKVRDQLSDEQKKLVARHRY